jgi:hypothetical protein
MQAVRRIKGEFMSDFIRVQGETCPAGYRHVTYVNPNLFVVATELERSLDDVNCFAMKTLLS